VRAIGASNFTADRLAQSLAVSEKKKLPRYESLQPLYNLYDRAEFEQTLAPLCREQQVGVISYYGLPAVFSRASTGRPGTCPRASGASGSVRT